MCIYMYKKYILELDGIIYFSKQVLDDAFSQFVCFCVLLQCYRRGAHVKAPLEGVIKLLKSNYTE